MPNVQPGDIAFYVGPEHKNGPRYMQFCKVKGPVQPQYRLIGCCGTHVVYQPMTMELVWSVEWSNPIPVGVSSAGEALSIVEAPERDRYLRKLDGQLTDEDMQREGEEDRVIEAKVATLQAKLSHFERQGYVMDREGIVNDYRRFMANASGMLDIESTFDNRRFGMWAAAGRFVLRQYYRVRRLFVRPRGAAAGVRIDPGLGLQATHHCEGQQ